MPDDTHSAFPFPLTKSWAVPFTAPGFQPTSMLSDLSSSGLKQRNTFLDTLFYDLPGLTDEEVSWLTHNVNEEGSILIVRPAGEDGPMGVSKFTDHAEMVKAQGRMVQRFAIAGVGSSDLGAAAFARTLANHYGEPVGAIVAGYGVADLMAEALTGWFVFGGANRFVNRLRNSSSSPDTSIVDATAVSATSGSTAAVDDILQTGDTKTLYKLLIDKDRDVLSIAGHSKGCLSIMMALWALVLEDKHEAAVEKVKQARIVHCGAVVELPDVITNVRQLLGSIDWFGAMNSSPGVEYERVEGAWHHLNTAYPAHMDLAALLTQEPA